MCKFLVAGLWLLAGLPAYSQLISLGVKAGIPLSDPLQTSYGGSGSISHGVRRYVIGITGELHLPLSLSVEVDALYRRLGFDTYSSTGTQSRTTGNDWQLPFLAKYEFQRRPLVRPFVDAGLTYRHVSFSNTPIANPNSVGITVGGGVTFRLLFIRLSPEIRYTHFPTEVFGLNFNYIHSTSNQADFLVGFSF